MTNRLPCYTIYSANQQRVGRVLFRVLAMLAGATTAFLYHMV